MIVIYKFILLYIVLSLFLRVRIRKVLESAIALHLGLLRQALVWKHSTVSGSCFTSQMTIY